MVLASQQQFLAEVAAQGVAAKPDLQFTRVVNGFSAVADPSAVVLLERSPRVAGVYPVRAAFPAGMAQTSDVAAPLPARACRVRWNGDHRRAARHGCGSRDAVSPRPGELRASTSSTAERPRATTSVPEETDWRRTARRRQASSPVSAVPAGPRGVAPDVTVLPIRVAGWQRDAAGRWSIHGRTDQIIAGLERAVDPNRNGDAHDAARVTLIPLSEPFSAFPDNALSRAVSGAVALDSLVVVPAGNDGPGGPGFGSIGGPGGAPDALTAGAADLRPTVSRVSVSFRAGLRCSPPTARAAHGLGAGRRGDLRSVVVRNARELFGPSGKSRVAGRAALLAAGATPRREAMRAAKAGAAIVVLAGDDLPAGSLGLDPRSGRPCCRSRRRFRHSSAGTRQGERPRRWQSARARTSG